MGKGRGPQDPFGTYREWAEHRLDPGHYLGGTIEPHLRKSELGPRARRLSGIMLTASGAMGVMSLLALEWTAIGDMPAWLGYPAFLLTFGGLLLVIWAGVTLFRSDPATPRHPEKRRGSSQSRAARRR
ncbi:MAG TPA: hypothetical protein VFK57_11485 [Vicinamibacterales bacterium]|nr:hypothetical protein [Vicinamibacterales bacterium]